MFDSLSRRGCRRLDAAVDAVRASERLLADLVITIRLRPGGGGSRGHSAQSGGRWVAMIAPLHPSLLLLLLLLLSSQCTMEVGMRIGLLVDCPQPPAWQQQVATLLSGTGAEVVAIAPQIARDERSACASSSRGLVGFRSLIFRWGERLDRWIARRHHFARYQAHPVGIEVISQIDALETLAEFDLLIDLETGVCSPSVWTVGSQPTLWSLRLSSYGRVHGVPRGFWESVYGDEIVEVTVSDVRSGRVLRRRAMGCMRRSWVLQQWMIEAMAGPILLDALADFRRHGTDTRTVHAPSLPIIDNRPELGMPSLGALTTAVGRAVADHGQRLLRRAKRVRPQWSIFIGRKIDGQWQLREFEQLVPPAGRIWADPFPCRLPDANGRDDLVVFAEDMSIIPGCGKIVALRRGLHGWNATTVISESYHLSYPFLFEWQGQRFIVPEAADAHEIPLYRMGDSFVDWRREEPLMRHVRAVDSSLLVHDGRIWLFTNILREPDLAAHYYELHLFFSSDFPTSRWTPHPSNPVVCDARYARMGGGFFRHNGALFRIAQGSRCGEYGTTVELRRITRLDTCGYEEQAAGSLAAAWQPRLRGMHHMAILGDVMVVDAWRDAPIVGDLP